VTILQKYLSLLDLEHTHYRFNMSINKFVQIKDSPNFYRDVHSKGLVNTDHRALEEYKNARRQRQKSSESIVQYENDINTLKDEVTFLKESLKLILDKMNSQE